MSKKIKITRRGINIFQSFTQNSYQTLFLPIVFPFSYFCLNLHCVYKVEMIFYILSYYSYLNVTVLKIQKLNYYKNIDTDRNIDTDKNINII